MQTNIATFIRDTEQGREADRILRSCVHCGFCTATCPTYQLLGDELDGPRGRIYLIKQVLEGASATRRMQKHLDRCLTCLNCMTTCPSGVHYSHLADIGREVIDQRVMRPVHERVVRWALRRVLPYGRRFGPLLRLGQLLRPVLPAPLRSNVPPKQASLGVQITGTHARRVLILDGCVQPAMTPRTNEAAAAVLDRLGITVVSASGAGCCGALSHHLTALEEARDFMRRNIDAWWPHIEAGSEAVVVTASGCGAVVKEYGYHLREDPRYAEKARRVAELTKDVSEVVAAEEIDRLQPRVTGRIAFHSPCTLQHGQKLQGIVEGLLVRAGYELVPVADAHQCCGSAGTYSILQANLSERLRERKLQALQTGDPDLIATANIGCQVHLQAKAKVPVVHWLELFAPGT